MFKDTFVKIKTTSTCIKTKKVEHFSHTEKCRVCIKSNPLPLKLLSFKVLNLTESKSKAQIVYFTDSIGANANFPVLELALGAKIDVHKAYSSDYNTWVPGQGPKWSRKLNFQSVVPKVMATKLEVHLVVFHCSSTDITNSPTGELVLFYKSRAKTSSTNMVKIAVETVETNENIETLIIIKRAPRFDEFREISEYSNNCLEECLEEEIVKKTTIASP